MLCLCVVAGIANAQEKKPQVIQSEPQLEDIYNVLEAMDIHMFRFELKRVSEQSIYGHCLHG